MRIWNVSEIAPDYEPDVVLDDNIDEPITAVAVDVRTMFPLEKQVLFKR